MTGSMGRQGGDVARGAGAAAARGVLVIGLAVLVGAVLLQVVDDGTSGPVTSEKPAATTTTTTGDEDGTTTTTTGETAEPPKNPDQLRVVVLNAGGPRGSAGAMSEALRQKGYTTQDQANDDDQERSGTVVHCRAGLEREAAALAIAVAEGTPTEPFPERVIPHTEGIDCAVLVGAEGATATTTTAPA